jgi:hypothetical protein
MFMKMKTNLGTADGPLMNGQVYDLASEIARGYQRAGQAEQTTDPTPEIAELLGKLNDGAGKPCLFLPFVGEFGHQVMSHMRLVHFHRATEKIVCCRRGEEVLYPSATHCFTDWPDIVPDAKRIATMRSHRFSWPCIEAQFPDHHPVETSPLTPAQEIYAIKPDRPIPFRPIVRGLRADIVFGVRRRDYAPERNWAHWQRVADHLSRAYGYSFAVIGAKETSHDLHGQSFHSRDYDTDAAIELLQNCRLYIGQDSGNSHLAATVGSRMVLFREQKSGSRDLTGRMHQVNPQKIDVVPGGWIGPGSVVDAAVSALWRSAA